MDETSVGEVIEEDGWADGVAAASFVAWLSCLKKGFFDSLLMDDDGPRLAGASGGLVVVLSDGVNVGSAGASGAEGLFSLERTWLLVGVVS